MINGLTAQNGQIIISDKPEFKGKISTGYAPNEGPNKGNFPKAAGHFRILKKVMRKQRMKHSQKMETAPAWVENEKVQKAIDKKGDGEPRLIKCISWVMRPEQMWSSKLIMFNSKSEMVCSSCGKGCVADFYQQQGDKRVRTDRECLYKDCPDYQSKECKENGMMVVWPEDDMDRLTPYKFTTTSINTIINIESMLHQLFQQLGIVHVVEKQKDAKAIPMGLLGVTFYLKHEQIISGGRKVWITKLIPSKTVQDQIRDANKAVIADGGQSLLAQVMTQSRQVVYDAEFSDVPLLDVNEEIVANEESLAIETSPSEEKVKDMPQNLESASAMIDGE